MASRSVIPTDLQHSFTDSDLTQNILVTAIKKFGEFRGETEEAFYSWMFKITKRVTLDAVRYLLAAKRVCRRETALEPNSPGFDLPDRRLTDPSEIAAKKEAAYTQDRAIRRLSPEDEELIRWLMSGDTFSSIANKLRIGLDAVYKRLARAQERLC